MIDRETVEVYERGARTYADRGTPPDTDSARALRAAADRHQADGWCVDVGCGPGTDLAALGPGVLGVDPARAMLDQARRAIPRVALVRAAAEALPLRSGAFSGAWSNKALQHVPAAHLPRALAELHRTLSPGSPLSALMFGGEGSRISDDDLPGRHFQLWSDEELVDLVGGAGFTSIGLDHAPPRRDRPGRATRVRIRATRARTIADSVGPGMRLLVCGLNPSLHAADAGVGYVGPGNRFWPALAEAGLAPPGTERQPWSLLDEAAIGMTDLVKRATARADEVTGDELRAGIDRVGRLCERLEPVAVCVVGLGGWRAVHPRAVVGWQPEALGPSPVYLMPSSSGLNARTALAELVGHLRTAAAGR